MQQILTLKLIGLSLDEIKFLLTSDTVEISYLLARQKQMLHRKVDQLLQVIQTIEQAQAVLNTSQTPTLEQFINIIKAVNMNNRTNWLEQFLTGDQQAKLAESEANRTFTSQKQTGEAWQKLFHDIQAADGKEVSHPDVQALVVRWDDLMRQFTGSNPELADNLNQAYAHFGSLEGKSDRIQAWQDAARFIQQARNTASL